MAVPLEGGTPPCFLYVWQGKDLQEGERQGKGLRADFADVWQGKELQPLTV